MADKEDAAELERREGRSARPQETEVGEEEQQQQSGGDLVSQRGDALGCRKVRVGELLRSLRRSHHPIDHRAQVLDPAVRHDLSVLESREERVVVFGEVGGPGGRPAPQERQHDADHREGRHRPRGPAPPPEHEPDGEEHRRDLDGRRGHEVCGRAHVACAEVCVDPQQDEQEDHLVDLYPAEVVQREDQREDDGEDEGQRSHDPIGVGSRHDALCEPDRDAEQREVQERENLRRERQRKNGEHLEGHRGEWRVDESSRPGEVAVIQWSPRGEVVACLPEDVEVAADALAVAAVAGDQRSDDTHGCR